MHDTVTAIALRSRFFPKRLSVVLLDVAVVLGAYLFAFLLRFDFSLAPINTRIILQTLPFLLTYLAALRVFSLYRGIYYFSSFADLLNITKAVAAAGVSTSLIILFIRQGQFPRSVLILHPILTFLGIGGVRFGIRLIKSYINMPRSHSGVTTRADSNSGSAAPSNAAAGSGCTMV